MNIGSLLIALLETIGMTIIGTILAYIIGFPIGFFLNITSKKIFYSHYLFSFSITSSIKSANVSYSFLFNSSSILLCFFIIPPLNDFSI